MVSPWSIESTMEARHHHVAGVVGPRRHGVSIRDLKHHAVVVRSKRHDAFSPPRQIHGASMESPWCRHGDSMATPWRVRGGVMVGPGWEHGGPIVGPCWDHGAVPPGGFHRGETKIGYCISPAICHLVLADML